jgi:hypothetical protein
MFRWSAFPLLVAILSLAADPAWAIPKSIKAVMPEPANATSTTSQRSARTYWPAHGRHNSAGWGWQPRWRRARH